MIKKLTKKEIAKLEQDKLCRTCKKRPLFGSKKYLCKECYIKKQPYPHIVVESMEDVDKHKCLKYKNINVCTCLFEFVCKKCKQTHLSQSVHKVKHDLFHGCFSCCRKKDRIRYRANFDSKISKRDANQMRTLGTIAEGLVKNELEKKGFNVFVGTTGYENYIDLVCQNKKNGKMKSIQVKSTFLNHNDFTNNNGFSALSQNRKNVVFDFLVVYMYHYSTFWIVPKEDLLKKFVSVNPKSEKITFTVNWLKIDDKKAKIYPYQDAWELITTSLK